MSSQPAVPLPALASPEAPRRRERRRLPGTVSWSARTLGVYVGLVVGGVVMVYPFLWMLATSLRTSGEVASSGASVIPQTWNWGNYASALGTFPFWDYLTNSLITTIIPIFGTIFASSLAGFAFARIRVKGAGFLFVLVLATMLLPGEVTLVPQFILFRELGEVNTLYPLIIPAMFGSPFYIFLFRQFYLRLPQSLVDASRIDGLSWFRTWRSIFVPLSRPIMAATAALLFIGYWNNFLGPTIYINSDRWKTLPLALSGFQAPATGAGVNYPDLMALNTVMIIPCVILFFVSQRSFMKGISFSGSGGQ